MFALKSGGDAVPGVALLIARATLVGEAIHDHIKRSLHSLRAVQTKPSARLARSIVVLETLGKVSWTKLDVEQIDVGTQYKDTALTEIWVG